MNRQPYATPPRWWQPKLTLRGVRWSRGWRRRQLKKKQNIEQIDVVGAEYLQNAVRQGHGILIAPNHSTHYDSAALYIACDRIDVPLYFLTAWQVFAMSTRFEAWAMQHLGCFSIDRESTDRQAFKQAIQVVQQEPHPLVVFPEGDIYHTNDAVTPFRDGAAAIALSAAKRAERKVCVIPCGIKFFYVDDPTVLLNESMNKLEEAVFMRPAPHRNLIDRIYRLAEGMVALKELDYFAATRAGPLRERILALTDEVLTAMEGRYELPARRGTTPERVKTLRQVVIRKTAELAADNGQSVGFAQDMEDLFFVMQLYSYPGNYLHDGCSIERIAETLDKFEEDILRQDLPSVRGRRRVVISFGEPIHVTAGEGKRQSAAELTQTMEAAVQTLIDEINQTHAAPAAPA
jgi:1-acyl-sn-glycerol-3-phosphate acyltransferase